MKLACAVLLAFALAACGTALPKKAGGISTSPGDHPTCTGPNC